MTLLRWLTLQIPDCNSHSPALLDLFISSDASICSTMVFPQLGSFHFVSHVVVSVSIDFLSNSKGIALFYHIAYDYSCAAWDGLHDHLRDVPWEDIFKLGAPAATKERYRYIFIFVNIRSSLTHLHDFQLLVLLP